MGAQDSELQELCTAEYPRLVGALRLACGHDAALAEEFAQEALARLCRDWEQVVSGPSPRAWLYRVAFNLVNSYWRRMAVRRRVEPKLIDSMVVADHAGATADRMDVRQALARLSQRERCVLALRYFVDMPVDQAAHALGISDQAIRSLSHRAIKKLRTTMSDEIGTVEVRRGS